MDFQLRRCTLFAQPQFSLDMVEYVDNVRDDVCLKEGHAEILGVARSPNTIVSYYSLI